MNARVLPAVLLLLILALLLPPISTPAAAQNHSSNRGFMLGADFSLVGMDLEGGELDSGGGLGLVAGYGFGSHLQLFIGAAEAILNPEGEGGDYHAGIGDLGLRYAFVTLQHRWRPFVEAGFSTFNKNLVNVDFEEFGVVDLELLGYGLMVGAGVNYFVTPALALGASVRRATGSFDEARIGIGRTVKLDDSVAFGSSRLQLGVKHYFSGH